MSTLAEEQYWLLRAEAENEERHARQRAAVEQSRPVVVFRPTLKTDGDQWCFLLGENLQNGVAGFGSSPEAAAKDFDHQWRTAKAGPYRGE